jgi:hypothetical protein
MAVIETISGLLDSVDIVTLMTLVMAGLALAIGFLGGHTEADTLLNNWACITIH